MTAETQDRIDLTRRRMAAAATMAALLPPTSRAQGDSAVWPSKPIKIVIPQGPGGGVDIMARILAKELNANLNVPVVVENRTGAAAMIGSAYVAKSAPDGYTLLYGFQTIPTTNPHLYKNAPLDPLTDLVPITQTLTGSYVLTVNNDVPAKNLPQLVAYVKSNPGKLSYGSYGAGSGHHLTTELLCQRTGMEMVHIPYKDPPVVDLIAGRIQVLVEAGLVAKEYVRSGSIRAIAITAPKRNPSFPEVPTLSETYPGLVVTGWQAFWAPKGTPDALVEKISQEVKKILQISEIRQRIADFASEPAGTTPAELKAIIAEEYKMWGDVIRRGNIRVEG